MTSQSKIEANRRNAKLSTGPKTLRGKAASRRNAIKHGLASVLLRHVEHSEDKELLEAVGASADARQEQLDHAITVSETTRELMRVRQARAALYEAFEKTNFSSESLTKSIARLDRYETRARARRRKAARRLTQG